MLNIPLIKRNLARLGLSQTDLASLCNVSKEAVSTWLTGESTPRPAKLRKLCEIFSVEIEELFVENSDMAVEVMDPFSPANYKLTSSAKDKVKDQSAHLLELVQFLPLTTFFNSPVLTAPELAYDYIQLLAREVCSFRPTRKAANLTPITLEKLIQLHADLETCFVPQLKKQDSEMNFLLNIGDDRMRAPMFVFGIQIPTTYFKYALARLLGQACLGPSQKGADVDTFIAAFAYELLYPFDQAVQVIEGKSGLQELKALMTEQTQLHDVSYPVVFNQLALAATVDGIKPPVFDFNGSLAKWSAKMKTKSHSVASALYGNKSPSIASYVEKSEEIFSTHIFKAIGDWQINEGGRSPAFIREALNIELFQALAISILLTNRNKA